MQLLSPQSPLQHPTKQTCTNKLLPGQYYDQETGLHYNWFRYYDPSTGRYITSDPIGLAGRPNTYLYANANPVIFSDPQGLNAGVGVGIGIGIAFCARYPAACAAGAVAICRLMGACSVPTDDNVIPFPGNKEEGEQCPPADPDDDDPCQEWHDDLLEVYNDIVSGSTPASQLTKQFYNNAADTYHANCPGYPRLPTFTI